MTAVDTARVRACLWQQGDFMAVVERPGLPEGVPSVLFGFCRLLFCCLQEACFKGLS